MPGEFEDRVKELTQGMWRKKFFAVFWEGGNVDLKPHLAEHLEYLIKIEREGKLFASGPLDLGRSSDGLTILRVGSIDEARRIALNDPFVVNGLRSFRIREWVVMEGSFGLSVNFSDLSINIS